MVKSKWMYKMTVCEKLPFDIHRIENNKKHKELHELRKKTKLPMHSSVKKEKKNVKKLKRFIKTG